MIPDPIERIIDDVTLIGLTEPEAAAVRGEIEQRHADDAQAAYERGRKAGIQTGERIALEVYKWLRAVSGELFSVQSHYRDGVELYPDAIFGIYEDVRSHFPYLAYADLQLPNDADVLGKIRALAAQPAPAAEQETV